MTNPDLPPVPPGPSAGAMIQKMLEIASANCSPVVWTDKGVYLYGIFYPRRPLLYSDKECPEGAAKNRAMLARLFEKNPVLKN